MKSYPSSELRNMCDEHITTEEPPEKEDLLQQMLERRWDHEGLETGCFYTVPITSYAGGSSISIHVFYNCCQDSLGSAGACTES